MEGMSEGTDGPHKPPPVPTSCTPVCPPVGPAQVGYAAGMSLLLLVLACDRPASGYATPGAALSVTVTELGFLDVPVGGSLSLSVDIVNAGDRSETIDATVSSSAEPSPYAVAATSLTISPDTTSSLLVRYTALDYRATTGLLTLTTPDDTFSVEVQLTGTTLQDADQAGQAAVEAGGTDCDDEDATVYAGALDVCYDGTDADCDAVDGIDPEEADCDGDGYLLGPDCADDDPTVHPGGSEATPGVPDGKDQDCDGLTDEDYLVVGEIVVTEISTGDGGWIEVCNGSGRPVPVGGFVIDTSADSVRLDSAEISSGACLAVCERQSNDCLLEGHFNVHGAGDTVRVTADALLLDSVAIAADWGWADGQIWSLDRAATRADLNDARASWCATAGSQGQPNPDCP